MALPKDPEATAEFAAKMATAIEASGLTPAGLYNRVVMATGNKISTSVQHLRDMADGKVNPHVANLNVLGALLRTLGLPPDGLGPVVEQRIQILLANVGSGPGDGGEQVSKTSPWITDEPRVAQTRHLAAVA